MGGFVFSLIGHQPARDETAVHAGVVFRVEDTDQRRIHKVCVTLPEPKPIEEDEELDPTGILPR